MNKPGRTEPICETSERCEALLSVDQLEQIKFETARRVAEVFGYRSDREIACLLRTSCSAVNSVIEGRELPSTKLLLLIHCVTGVSIHWLLTGKGMKSQIPSAVVFATEELAALGLA